MSQSDEARRTSRYQAPTDYLLGIDSPRVELIFPELDRIVGGLPPSAKKHQAWWSNSYTSQPHARYWLDANRRASPDLVRGVVVFEVGAPTTDQARTRSPTLATNQLQLAPVVTGQVESLTVAFEYLDAGRVVLDESDRVRCPTLPAQPGIYRFVFQAANGTMTTYIGETDNLARRMTNYRLPGPAQPTNVRLNARFTATLAAGGIVTASVVLAATVNGTALDLSYRPARLLVENAILVRLRSSGAAVENL
jgi:hypothetical protein